MVWSITYSEPCERWIPKYNPAGKLRKHVNSSGAFYSTPCQDYSHCCEVSLEGVVFHIQPVTTPSPHGCFVTETQTSAVPMGQSWSDEPETG